MNERISIIVPVYDVENYIRPCLNSIINQSYRNLEIILVDDGSTDGSGDICEEYSKSDPRIQVIHKENGGLSDARNKGMRYAAGEYIMFVDSDDVISEYLAEYLYQLITETGADIGICDPVHCGPNEKITFEKETKRQIFSAEKAICEMLYQKSFLVAAWGKIYRRRCLDEILFPVGMLFEDSAVMYRIFDKANKIAYGNARLYGYVHRENSITMKAFSGKDCDILNICSQIIDYTSERSREMQKAAASYQVSGALRVFLNAPKTEEYAGQVRYCKHLISQKGIQVMADRNARRKTKLAVALFYLARPVMPFIYKKIDRWK